jgi:predicted aconitase
MKLTEYEKALLDGGEGPARQKALELLVKYGDAVGAERFVETNNVCSAVNAGLQFIGKSGDEFKSIDDLFSEFYLDSSEYFEIPKVKAYSCRLITYMDADFFEIQGISPKVYDLNMRMETFCKRIGMQLTNTCAPYLVGNIPVRGEHCAWMESSAVIYINSVFGARTNTEGCETSACSMLVGRTPFWGLHNDEKRLGTHLVEVDFDVETVMDWGLLGFWVGEKVQENVPVLKGIRKMPNAPKLKHHGAAAATSGGVELYHIVGFTPEARTMEEAFGRKKPAVQLKFGREQRRQAYEHLNSASDPNVDFVVLGCPHYDLEQIWSACKLLEGRKVHPNTNLWIFAPKALQKVADRQGCTEILSRAGAKLMADTCPAIGRVFPKGTRIAATDSAKQAHYMPAILGFPTWFGSQEDCIQAAITGKWRGDIK